MKRALTAVLLAVALLLSGCSPVVESVQEEVRVYASFYPIYALSSLVLDGVSGIRLSCLSQPQDGCLRSYEMSDWDMHLLAYDADALIMGGRGLESYEGAMYSLGGSAPALINAMYALDLYNDDGDAVQISEDTSHLVGENPYYYMSVTGAARMVENIADSIAGLLPEKADEIAENGISARKTLSDLRSRTQEICADVRGQKVILLNEALIYPAMDYALEVEYWYDRESGDTLYGAQLTALIDALAQCHSRVVLIEKQAPAELVRALEDAGFRVALMDIMNAYALGLGGEGYISAQLENARAIAGAFGSEVE